ncbi:MAG: hypothetical protein ACKVUS_11655 [Saprospiraceae bacterium]
MKPMLYLIVFATMLAACKKDKGATSILEIWDAGPMDTGWGSAVRDGSVWQATAFAVHHSTDTNYIGLYFNTYTTDGSRREQILLNEIPLQLGKYPLKGHISEIYDGSVGSTYGCAEDDGDVLGAAYHPDDGEGIFELTKLDMVNKVVAGTFTRIVFKNRISNSPYPQTVIFENGKFEMSITD